MVSPVLAQAILGQRPIDFVGQFQQGREEKRAAQARTLSSELLQSQFQGGKIGELAGVDPTAALQLANALNIPTNDRARLEAFAKDTQIAFGRASAGDVNGAVQFVRNRRDARRAQGVDTANMDDFLARAEQNPDSVLPNLKALNAGFVQAGMTKSLETSAGQREFESLTKGLTPEEKETARRVKLGLAPRAIGSAAQTIADLGTAEKVGESQATIKQRAKFGELTGASRAKRIDSGFARIEKIGSNIRNLDRAIKAVEAGAGTGAIESRFPSIRAASVELDQIQGELALDVVGAVTFGALSKGELDLAKKIALPTGLDGPQLIQHLRDRQAAQIKLRDYFQEQIDFLDRGGSIAGFLREMGRQNQGTAAARAQPQPVQPSAVTGQPAATQDLSTLSDAELQALLQGTTQ